MTRKIYCSSCTTNFTEIPADAALAPDFRFVCRQCYTPDNRVVGLGTAHDPRLDRAGTPEGTAARRPRPEEISHEEFVRAGFHLDGRTPKPMKPGPEWSRSNEFLRELLADRTDEEKGKALVLIVGRWRQSKTFQELAAELSLLPEDVRKNLSAFRTEGDRLWAKKQRAAAKAEKNAQVSARAKALSERGLTVREVAEIMGLSIGFISELQRAA